MRYLKNVAQIDYDINKCTGCTMCIQVCPHGVFNMYNKKALLADKDACMECGACMMNCPVGAIQVLTGVGCAAAVLNKMLGKSDVECC